MTKGKVDALLGIVFGDEGQAYKLMPIEEFLHSKQAVPQLQGRLKDYLEEVK